MRRACRTRRDVEPSEWSLPAVIPSAGLVGLLFFWLVRIMRQSSVDRTEFGQTLVTERESHATEMRELREAHLAEIDHVRQRHSEDITATVTRYDEALSSLQRRIVDLEGQVVSVRTEFEQERRARWRAEDLAARYRRRVGGEEIPT